MIRYSSLLAALSLFLISAASAQEPPCDDTVFAEVHNDTIIVYHDQAEHNCCPEIVYTLIQQDSVIDLVETDTLHGCDCMCCIGISVTITDLPSGRYLIRVWNWDQSILHGEVWVTIGPGEAIRPYLGEVVQFPCSSSILIEEEGEFRKSPQVPLVQNFPNPFRTQTCIRYQLHRSDFVMLKIYNCHGNLLRTLLNCEQGEGIHSVFWDGKHSSGEDATAGVYFYRLQVGESTATEKIVVLR